MSDRDRRVGKARHGESENNHSQYKIQVSRDATGLKSEIKTCCRIMSRMQATVPPRLEGKNNYRIFKYLEAFRDLYKVLYNYKNNMIFFVTESVTTIQKNIYVFSRIW